MGHKSRHVSRRLLHVYFTSLKEFAQKMSSFFSGRGGLSMAASAKPSDCTTSKSQAKGLRWNAARIRKRSKKCLVTSSTSARMPKVHVSETECT